MKVEMSPFTRQFDLEEDIITNELNSVMFNSDLKKVVELSRE